MLWKEEWRAISAQIEGVVELARLFATSGQQEFLDASDQTLVPMAKGLMPRLEHFQTTYASMLPKAAQDCLADFVRTQTQGKFRAESGVGGLHGGLLLTGILVVFRADMAHHLADRDLVVRRRIDRAFVHLQRSIVADPEIRRKWENAFADGETRCEALGAVHLLEHGIWAFKAHAEGGRTDLVLGGPQRLDEVERVADALVLTEWKLVRRGDSAKTKAEEALYQAKRYIGETLAGIELDSTRYLVLVSEPSLVQLPDVPTEGRVRNVVVNIAVSPETPHRESLAAARAKTT